MVQVNVGSSLRETTNRNPVITVDGASLAEVIARIDERYPGFARSVLSGSGQLRSNVAVTRAADGRALDVDAILKSDETIRVSLKDVAGG